MERLFGRVLDRLGGYLIEEMFLKHFLFLFIHICCILQTCCVSEFYTAIDYQPLPTNSALTGFRQVSAAEISPYKIYGNLASVCRIQHMELNKE
jgi:hypothetical protein